MNKSLLLIPAAFAGLFFAGCADQPYYGRVVTHHRDYYDDRGPYAYDYSPPDYYADGGYYGPGEVDFYYEGGRPYSRDYGPLVFRDNRYYYSRGGNYIVYDRDRSFHHRDERGRDERGRPRYQTATVQQQYRGGTYGSPGYRSGVTSQHAVVRSGPNGQYSGQRPSHEKGKKKDDEHD